MGEGGSQEEACVGYIRYIRNSYRAPAPLASHLDLFRILGRAIDNPKCLISRELYQLFSEGLSIDAADPKGRRRSARN
jgi:hypothetical protein